MWNHPRQSPTIHPSLSYFPVFSSPTATLEVVGNTGNMSSDKAGVGGSTPSLATMFFNRLAKIVEVHTKHQFAFIVGGRSHKPADLESLIYLTVIDFLLGESSESAAFHQFCALAS